MKREIEFRAWINDEMKDKICLNMYGDYFYHDGRRHIGLASAIVMQYTGLKDKNGTKIFEGDVLKLDKEHMKSVSALIQYVNVKFHEGSYMYNRSQFDLEPNTYLWMVCRLKHCELVGNIHEATKEQKKEWEK